MIKGYYMVDLQVKAGKYGHHSCPTVIVGILLPEISGETPGMPVILTPPEGGIIAAAA